jgi:hypothetical protein
MLRTARGQRDDAIPKVQRECGSDGALSGKCDGHSDVCQAAHAFPHLIMELDYEFKFNPLLLRHGTGDIERGLVL